MRRRGGAGRPPLLPMRAERVGRGECVMNFALKASSHLPIPAPSRSARMVEGATAAAADVTSSSVRDARRWGKRSAGRVERCVG